jgi:hypothetical protein
MKVSELRVGLRVMVPQDKLTDGRPWQEPYGKVIEIERFLDTTPLVLVLLDGDSGRVVSCEPHEVDYE